MISDYFNFYNFCRITLFIFLFILKKKKKKLYNLLFFLKQSCSEIANRSNIMVPAVDIEWIRNLLNRLKGGENKRKGEMAIRMNE